MTISLTDRVLAIDIGGTHVRIGTARRIGAPEEPTRLSAERLRSEDPVRVLSELIAAEAIRNSSPPAAVVLAVPGPIDLDRGIVIEAPNIPTLNGLPLAERLSAACGIAVFLDHDAALAARGEHAFGAGVGVRFMLAVYLGTGIGAAFLDDGRPLGGGAYRMQLGHIPVRGEGRRCPCGGTDCIEAYASGVVLNAVARRFDRPIASLFSAAAGCAPLAAALDRFVEDQALALATAITLLDPEITVVGGGIVDMADYPLDQLFAATRRRLAPIRGSSAARLARAQLGWSAILHGALAVFDQAQRDSGFL
jgi:allose kinase